MGTKGSKSVIFLLVIMPVWLWSQGHKNFSPVYRYKPTGLKIIGKFDNHYYTLRGLHNPWQRVVNNDKNLYQNHRNLYPQKKIKFFNNLKNLYLTKYNQGLEKKWDKKLSCTDSLIQPSACFTYQGVIWLYYVHKKGQRGVLKLQKFDLSGRAISQAQHLMTIKLDDKNKAYPFFIQLSGDSQRFLVLHGGNFRLFNTRCRKIYSGKLPYRKIRQLHLYGEKTIFYIDEKSKEGKTVYDFVKFFPRIEYANRQQIEAKNNQVYDAFFEHSSIRKRIKLYGITGDAFDEYFVQTFDISTFKLIDQKSGEFNSRVLKALDFSGKEKHYRLGMPKKIYDEPVLVVEETLNKTKPAEGGSGDLILHMLNVPDDKDIQTRLVEKSHFTPSLPDYRGYRLFGQNDKIYCFFNQFNAQKHKGLYMAKFPVKSNIRVKRLLKPKEGGVITCPGLFERTGKNELLFYGFEDDEYRLIRYRFK